MDDRRFDALTRSLAAPRTRRGLFGAATALAAGLLGAHATDAQVSQFSCGNQACASNPGGCKPGCVCCVYTNAVGQVTNSRCRPPGTCAPGTVACPTGHVVGPSGVCAVPTTTTTPAPLPNGSACTAPTECASANCCQGGTARAGLCGVAGSGVCTNNDDCCSATCIGGTCGQPRGAGEICDAGDGADCQAGLTCCDSLTNDPGDFVCRDLSADTNNCGACNTVCPAGQVCAGGSCACPFNVCDSGCCPNATDICLGEPGSTTCGSLLPLGEICVAADGLCASGHCARVETINDGNTPVCCTPLGGPCTGGGTFNTDCCDDGIDGTNTTGNAAGCSGTITNPGVCCVHNNFPCTDVSQCCRPGFFGRCEAIGGVRRCCQAEGGFCGLDGVGCCEGVPCINGRCIREV